MPIAIRERDDLRFLAEIDKRHSFLRPEANGGVKDGWFDRKGYTLLSERAADGTPLVAVALDYPVLCPIDATADMMIRYWLANLNRKADLLPAYVKNIVAINEAMVSVGAERVWGLVPKKAEHMTSFLDRVAAAGKCRKVDGAGVSVDVEAGQDAPYQNFYFYIGERQAVTDFMRTS